MATKHLAGQWNSIVGAVKEKYGQITDDDLVELRGDVDQLVGLLQKKTGQAREQIEAFVQECSESCDSMTGRISQRAENASEAVREGYDQVAEKARRGYQYSATSVAKHPLESVGIALGVGAIAGLLVGLTLGAQRERELSWRERFLR